MTTQRDYTLDIMRGLAVFIMIQGNIAGSLFAQPHPTWIMTYLAIGSFVPALFVLIAGMMVVYTTIHKGYTLKHFLVRAGIVFFAAAIILDILVWGFVPFTGFDVLYLIALALPLSFLFQKLSSVWRWSIVLAIFLATPFLQFFFGYTAEPLTISILTGHAFGGVGSSILQHWLIDGWFPVFPWLGFAFLGVNLGLMRWKERVLETFAKKEVVYVALGLILIGGILWFTQATQVFVRSGFAEVIYPPTLAYIITAIGEILLLFALVNWNTTFKIYKPLIVFGQSALFMYIFHFALMEYVWDPPESQILLLSLIGITLGLLLWFGYILRNLRKKYPKRPMMVRLFGI